MLKNIAKKSFQSFKNSLSGNENIKIIEVNWVIFLYILFFISHKFSNTIARFALSPILVALFSWHLYAIYKCRPKPTIDDQPTKEQLQIDEIKKSPSLLKKIFLQESFSKFNWRKTVVLADIFFIISALNWY